MRDGYLKFVGDFSHLKHIGFQYYSSNSMRWIKEGLTVYKRGSEVVHGEYDLYKLVKFLRDRPIVSHRSSLTGGKSWMTFFKVGHPDGISHGYEYIPYTTENHAKYLNYIACIGDDNTEDTQFITSILLDISFSDMLQDFHDLGWIIPTEYDDDE